MFLRVALFGLFFITSSGASAQTIPEPSAREMFDAMDRGLRIRGGSLMDIRLIEIQKGACVYLEPGAYRCSYRSHLEADCRTNPIACFAAQFSGIRTNQGLFTWSGGWWTFHGDGT